MAKSKAYWHLACYNKHYATQLQPKFFARFESTCSLCNQFIRRGDAFTWDRNPEEELNTDIQPDPFPPYYPALKQEPSTVRTTPTVEAKPATATVPAGTILPLVDVPDYVLDAKDGTALLTKSLLPHIKAALGYQLASAEVDYGKIATWLTTEVGLAVEKAKLVEHRHTVEIYNVETGERKDIGLQHKMFPTLLQCLKARKQHDGSRLNIWLSGPAGSGKTTAAKNAAEALGLRFGFQGALDAKYDLSGFINAAGVCVSTEFRRFYAEGGVFLLDELDSWNPAAQLWLNAALANGEASFPDGTLQRHVDFACIGAANTWGLGGTGDYVGRTKLDAAFLDRFSVKLDWQYDEDLEMALCPDKAFARTIQTLRAKAKTVGVKVIISPRKSIDGYALLAVGFTVEQVLDMTVYAGLSAEDLRRLKN
jgi:hypothetical protein